MPNAGPRAQTAGGPPEPARPILLEANPDSALSQALSQMAGAPLTLAEAQAASMADVHQRFIRRLEQHARLDRKLEALPDDEELMERARDHRGLTRPELAVLLA